MGVTSSVDAIPLCVDLDGTLVRTDVLFESIFVLLRKNFQYFFLLPLWLIKGKAYFKQQIADRADVDVSLLPYHEPFLNYLKVQKAKGRALILTTGSNIRYAEQITRYLGLFEGVLASDAETNLSGRRKRQRLLDAFGEKGFDYAGNAIIDLEISGMVFW
jgi:beta-phosphoglucomutase-like phosphatase (HAD superfamily)